MRKSLKRLTAFLLILLLVISMVPSAMAKETTLTTGTEETTSATEETITSTAESTEPPDEEDPAEDPNAGIVMASAEDYGIMPASGYQSSGVKLLNLASPYNYTCTLSSQVYVKYVPAGSSSAKTAGIQNVAWHYYSYNGVQDKDKTIYCIQPHLDYNQGSSGNYMDQGVDVWGSNSTGSIGSNAWYALSAAQRNAIGNILLYSEARWNDAYSVTAYSKNNNPNYSLRVATQVLIYEIVTGLRDPNSFARLSSNGYTSGSTLYDAFKDACPDFRTYYNGIVADVQSANLLPSFTSSSSSSAPTITLDGILTWVQDTNGVCGQFVFEEPDDDVWFNVYDSEIGMQNSYGFEGLKLYSCYRDQPSSGASSFAVFYGTSATYQTCVTLQSVGTGRLTGYFKVYAPSTTGGLNITKTTQDSQNLGNWPFSLYTNSACTSLAYGPYYTNSSGKISITGISPGLYYVKEGSHGTASINAKYQCASSNPQAVTITAGGTSSVSFTNSLRPGSLNVTKATEDGKNKGNWPFSLYSNSACTSLVSGPHYTDSNGKVTISGIVPGTYYIREGSHGTASINAMYQCAVANPQAVTITAGGTSSVSFTNSLRPGSLNVTKITEDGKNKGNWPFSLYSNSACTSLVSGPHYTDSNGKVTISGLAPGTYYIKEGSHGTASINAMYQCSVANPQAVAITAGGTSSVSFTNSLRPGTLELIKVTEDGPNRNGWLYSIYSDPSCTTLVSGPHSSNARGEVSVQLSAGLYYVKELGNEDETIGAMYHCVSPNPETVTITAGEKTTVMFSNALSHGSIQIIKATNIGGDLSGWDFEVFTDSGCTSAISGSPFTTGADGIITIPNLAPGKYYIREISNGDSYWDCDTSVKSVTVTANQTASVTVCNTHYGKLKILKTVKPSGSAEGCQFKVTDSTGWEIIDSPVTMTASGELVIDQLLPGKYTVEELISEDDGYICESENPQTVTVTEGQTAQVSFTNRQRSGSIGVHKVNQEGIPIAGAEFLLEWSEDGTVWQPVDNSVDLQKGGCSTPGLTNGKLVSTGNEAIIFENLYPTLQYRLTETKAPNNYQLLADIAYEGTLPADNNYTMEVTIVNMPNFALPKTGSRGRIITIVSLLTCLSGLAGAILYLRRCRW